jgi:hypothetical protein
MLRRYFLFPVLSCAARTREGGRGGGGRETTGHGEGKF